MSRAERLLALIQCLRRHRQPVSGQNLATELGISLRTLSRDIASLPTFSSEMSVVSWLMIGAPPSSPCEPW